MRPTGLPAIHRSAKENHVSNRRRGRIWIPLLVTAFLASGAVVCVTALAPAGPASRTALSAARQPAAGRTLTTAASSLQSFLKTSYGRSYAGLRIDTAGQQLMIYRKPDPALDAAARARNPHIKMVFRDAAFSLRQLLQLTNQITADRAHWARQGLDIQVVGAETDGSGVRVGATESSESRRGMLVRRYGTDAISIEKTAPVGLY
jgi:hypothetical protein